MESFTMKGILRSYKILFDDAHSILNLILDDTDSIYYNWTYELHFIFYRRFFRPVYKTLLSFVVISFATFILNSC